MRYRVFCGVRRFCGQSLDRLRLDDRCQHRSGALGASTLFAREDGQLFPCEEGGEAIH
jgi:hypothetical protein